LSEKVYLLAIDEHGNWKDELFIIGGGIFDINDLWILGMKLIKYKKKFLGFPLEIEVKWQHVTEFIFYPEKVNKKNPLKVHNVGKQNVMKYVENLRLLIDKFLKSALFSIVQLPAVGFYIQWKRIKDIDIRAEKQKRAQLELFIREKASQNIIQRYSWWLKNNIGLIAVDRFSNTKINNRETVEEKYQQLLRRIIYTGDIQNSPYRNVIPPFLAQSHLHAFIELNDFIVGAFSFLMKKLYAQKKFTMADFTKGILDIVIPRIRRGPKGQLWGYGIFDIPHKEATLRERIREEEIKT